MPDNSPGRWRIMVHYRIGDTVNIDTYTCIDYASDIKAGVLHLTDGADHENNPVRVVQYREPWRILILKEV